MILSNIAAVQNMSSVVKIRSPTAELMHRVFAELRNGLTWKIALASYCDFAGRRRSDTDQCWMVQAASTTAGDASDIAGGRLPMTGYNQALKSSWPTVAQFIGSVGSVQFPGAPRVGLPPRSHTRSSYYNLYSIRILYYLFQYIISIVTINHNDIIHLSL